MRSGEFHPEYEALRREYNDFRYHLPDALLEIDLASFQVLYANRMAEIVLGVTAGDVEEGLNGSALVAPGEFPRMLETMQGYLGESRANGIDFRAKTAKSRSRSIPRSSAKLKSSRSSIG